MIEAYICPPHKARDALKKYHVIADIYIYICIVYRMCGYIIYIYIYVCVRVEFTKLYSILYQFPDIISDSILYTDALHDDNKNTSTIIIMRTKYRGRLISTHRNYKNKPNGKLNFDREKKHTKTRRTDDGR
ncbi:unnamed protein product [Aphis gossypii]|uniref:Uncharacterized protein n=1 Tax=Aphis gossypii TaxID=80765 RepID=A0A9P0INB9_APHGO|nr:unnamed protein product [Aphis gossypii]